MNLTQTLVLIFTQTIDPVLARNPFYSAGCDLNGRQGQRKRETLVPTAAADWRVEEKRSLKEPVATRLVCKLADIVVRYVAARYTYAYSQVYVASKR